MKNGGQDSSLDYKLMIQLQTASNDAFEFSPVHCDRWHVSAFV